MHVAGSSYLCNIFNTFNIIYDIYNIFDKIVNLGNIEDIVNIESASKILNISQIPRSWICMVTAELWKLLIFALCILSS